MTPVEHDFIARHRVARLATANVDGQPHVIPVCYALDGGVIYSMLDLKPKRIQILKLKRVRNILENPSVSLVIDDYMEDWNLLSYVLVMGTASLIQSGREQQRATRLLREKYSQYRTLLTDTAPALRIAVERVITWGAVNSVSRERKV